MFIGDWMGRGARYWPDRLAVVDAGREHTGRFTYRQLNDRASALASWLQQDAGVERGDRVGLLAHNGVEYLDALFACAKLGAVFVPFNWRLHPRELSEQVRDTAPRVLLYGSDFADGALAARETDRTLALLCVDEPAYVEAVSPSSPHARARAAAPVLNENVDAEDTLCLLFTGGTTGRSKGARISYRMVAWNTLNTLVHELRGDDVTVTHTPMFHTGGLLVYTLPLLTAGGTVVIMRRWDPGALLRLVESEGVTVFFAVPAQYAQLLETEGFAQTDFSRVRFLTSGGAPLPVSLIEAWRAVHAVPFKQGFGMTEAGPGLFSMGPEHAVTKAGSIGLPNHFVEARLHDDAGREVAPGEVGELVLKGPVLFSGYYNDEAATRAAFDAEGWFHTGDLARRDEDGYVFIVDRKKDMFISGGENVYPAEIEAALYAHPGVLQCAVVGVPDPKWGEVGAAFVVPRETHVDTLTEEELLAHLRGRLARYKVPRHVSLRGPLPLSAAGKVLKRELRAHLNESSQPLPPVERSTA